MTKSASSTIQADLFDFILPRENEVKHMALYHERRLTKLEYSVASIINVLPYLKMIVKESHLRNQNIKAISKFLDS